MTSADGITRIAMWSGPRNISTALMRAFENRPDCSVVDEPFYAYYLHETGLDHPGRDIVLKSQPKDANSVIHGLLQPQKNGITVQYQKHMSHHILDHTPLAWMEGMQHCFLLRDPAAMIASYVKSRAEISLKDIGILQLKNLYDHVANKTDTTPLVIDSDDILNNPEGMLRLLCTKLEMPFTDKMLSWPAGPRDSDGAWAPYWYKNVEQSTHFEARKPFSGTLPATLQKIADAARPAYEQLAENKLVAG